jgi:hypothetical protein
MWIQWMGDNNIEKHECEWTLKVYNLEFKGLVVGRILFLLYLQE